MDPALVSTTAVEITALHLLQKAVRLFIGQGHVPVDITQVASTAFQIND